MKKVPKLVGPQTTESARAASSHRAPASTSTSRCGRVWRPRARQPQQPSSQKRHPSAGSATSTTSIRTAIGTAKTLGRWHHSAYLGRQRLSVTAASAWHLCTTFNPQVEDRATRPTPTRSIQQPARSLPAGGRRSEDNHGRPTRHPSSSGPQSPHAVRKTVESRADCREVVRPSDLVAELFGQNSGLGGRNQIALVMRRSVSVTGTANLPRLEQVPLIRRTKFAELWPPAVSTSVICLPMAELEGSKRQL
jgi:hypothetical protein